MADNSASSNPDIDGAFVSTTGDNLIEVVGTATGLHGSDIKGSDPDIGVLSDNGGDTFTHALLIGSAAINAGSTPGAPTIDQRGYTRVGATDIGAYEFAAGPIIVDTTADTVDGNTTSVWALFDNKGLDGFISLREAILAVNAGAGGDTISLGAGTYTFTAAADYEDLAVSGDLDITKDVTIIGAGAATTIIDAADIDRVFDVHNGTVMIQDLTMLDGDAGAENGGGIRIFNGATTDLVSVDIISNMAVSGGGIHSAGSLTLTDVTVDDNDATWGGGISIDDGSVTLDRVTISNNTSSNNGGGFYNFGVAASLANVTISGNSSSSNSGGGLWTNQAITATNVTIAHNSSNAGGAGIHAQGGGNVTLTNSILHNPSGLNANNSLISGGNNIDSDSSAGLGDPLDGFDPMLGTLADNAGPTQTHALLTGSVAIDNGTTAGAPVFDQRGVERDAAPDIGAYELGTPMATAFWTQDALLTPQFSSWDGTGFSVEANSASVGSYRFITGAESPTRDEMIVVGVDEISGAITGEIWDGSSWTALPFAMDTPSHDFWSGFDFAYEAASGDGVLVWNNGTDISFRVWNGSVWSNEAVVTLPVAGEPDHIDLVSSPDSNEIMLVARNESTATYAIVWDGTTWGNEQLLSATSSDGVNVYSSYESQSGDAMVVYGNGTSSVNFRIWDGTSWSGAASVSEPAASGNVRWTTLASDVNSDQVALSVYTGSEAWFGIWDGVSNWDTVLGGSDTNTSGAILNAGISFEAESGEALAVYTDTTNPSNEIAYRTWAGSWSAQFVGPDIGGLANSLLVSSDPTTDGVMLSVQNASQELNHVFWNGTTWGSAQLLENATGEITNQPFTFLWDQSSILTPVDSDGDGLWDIEEDANADLDNLPSTNPGPDTDGDSNANYLDADDDGDGVPTNTENADPNADGDPRDAIDSDHDGQPDYLDLALAGSDGTVIDEQKISDISGGLSSTLDPNDRFGRAIAGIGDLDGDGIIDMVVGALRDDDGGTTGVRSISCS